MNAKQGQMKGMRNRMVHGYFETNLELVWETVAVFLPELERKLGQTPD